MGRKVSVLRSEKLPRNLVAVSAAFFTAAAMVSAFSSSGHPAEAASRFSVSDALSTYAAQAGEIVSRQEHGTQVQHFGPAHIQHLHAVAAAKARQKRLEAARAAALAAAARRQNPPAPVSAPLPAGTYQQYAQAQLNQMGEGSQMGCLVALWNRESGWNPQAYNPSGAFGIPQALPGSKMASAGADWQTDGYTQIRWGLEYLNAVYGGPCTGWAHEEAVGSY